MDTNAYLVEATSELAAAMQATQRVDCNDRPYAKVLEVNEVTGLNEETYLVKIGTLTDTERNDAGILRDHLGHLLVHANHAKVSITKVTERIRDLLAPSITEIQTDVAADLGIDLEDIGEATLTAEEALSA